MTKAEILRQVKTGPKGPFIEHRIRNSAEFAALADDDQVTLSLVNGWCGDGDREPSLSDREILLIRNLIETEQRLQEARPLTVTEVIAGLTSIRKTHGNVDFRTEDGKPIVAMEYVEPDEHPTGYSLNLGAVVVVAGNAKQAMD